MLFSATESQHILNNCCSYNIALCQQSVMANMLITLHCIIISKP